eukprot:m51a1_g7500 putative glutamate dehydrogenase (956) ;mRNA; f:272434-275631
MAEELREKYRQWVLRCMPPGIRADLTERDVACVANGLAFQNVLLEGLHLNFPTHVLALCPDDPLVDEDVLKHYDGGGRGIASFRSYTSTEELPGTRQRLRLVKLEFRAPQRVDRVLQMPRSMGPILYKSALQHDEVQYHLFPDGTTQSVLCFAWRNVQRRFFLYRLAVLCRRYRLRMASLRFSYMSATTVECVLLGVVRLEGEVLYRELLLSRFLREFELLKNFRDDTALGGLLERDLVNGEQVVLLSTLSSFLEQLLVDVDPNLFSEKRIQEVFSLSEELTVDLLGIFETRFDPSKRDLGEHERRVAEFRSKLETLDTGIKAQDDRSRVVFGQALSLVLRTLRTNLYERHKLSVAMRMDPAYLHDVCAQSRATYPELPQAVLFVRGWNYVAFHVRMRPLARGGLRTVISWDIEQEDYKRANTFADAYDLAVVQQKKNKDVPEAGAHTFLFLRDNEEKPHEMDFARRELSAHGVDGDELAKAMAEFEASQDREYLLYNQRSFIHTLLSMVCWDNVSGKLKYGNNSIDYLGVPQLIFLGPDQNLHQEVVEWAAAESKRMDYFAGGAFITGKQRGAWKGQVHTLAVRGMLRFLDHALAYAGIRESEPFTVKMCGGPRGAIAGCCIRQLAAKYPQRARLVLVADRTGTVYNPDGLDMAQLQRMVDCGLNVDKYPAALLRHPDAWLLCLNRSRQASPVSCQVAVCSARGESWVSSNAAQHTQLNALHEKPATVFLPCGGRTRSLHSDNVGSFVREGRPTSRIVVEGANMYLTPDARRRLESLGAVVFKDSSANKGGVIASSLEELAGLCLTDEQFERINADFARDAAARIDNAVDQEARCTFEHKAGAGSRLALGDISDLISERIWELSDEVSAWLAGVDLEDPRHADVAGVFARACLPECMRRGEYGVQAAALVPDQYKRAAISKAVACWVVYHKGPLWRPTAADVLPLVLGTSPAGC